MEHFFLVAVLVSALVLPPWALGFFALCFAAGLLLDPSITPTLGSYAPFFLILLSLPGAAWIAGILLDEYCEIKWNAPFALLALCLGTLFLFSQGFVFKAFEFMIAPQQYGLAALCLSSFSAVTGAAGIIALTFMLITVLYELPLALLHTANNFRFPFRSLRLFAILFAFSLGFQLIAGFLTREWGRFP